MLFSWKQTCDFFSFCSGLLAGRAKLTRGWYYLKLVKTPTITIDQDSLLFIIMIVRASDINNSPPISFLPSEAPPTGSLRVKAPFVSHSLFYPVSRTCSQDVVVVVGSITGTCREREKKAGHGRSHFSKRWRKKRVGRRALRNAHG